MVPHHESLKVLLKRKILKEKWKIPCYVLLPMQSIMEDNHVNFRLKIKFNYHLINIICMKMSFPELLKILREHWDLDKIGFLFLELIFVKYISMSWKLIGEIIFKGEKKALITKKKYSESTVEFWVSLISCQLPYFRKTKRNSRNMSNNLQLIEYNKNCDIISSLQ